MLYGESSGFETEGEETISESDSDKGAGDAHKVAGGKAKAKNAKLIEESKQPAKTALKKKGLFSKKE